MTREFSLVRRERDGVGVRQGAMGVEHVRRHREMFDWHVCCRADSEYYF